MEVVGGAAAILQIAGTALGFAAKLAELDSRVKYALFQCSLYCS
jgi:hypothetical protein